MKLMKYELRKTWFPKVIALLLTAVAEVIFLIGFAMKKDNMLMTGILMLTLVTFFALFYIGLDSLLVLNKDLNTKQGYMLFMTPRNSFSILGAKILENGVSILLGGVFYLALAALDISLVVDKLQIQQSLVDMLEQMLNSMSPIKVELSFRLFAIIVLTVLVSWLSTIVVGAFAIILSSTLFTGKNWNLILSVVIYFAVSFLMSYLAGKMPSGAADRYFLFRSLVYLAFAAVFYVLSCVLMEKKLSV